MATILRPELSPKNKYHIDKHRYYELKQYLMVESCTTKDIENSWGYLINREKNIFLYRKYIKGGF